MLFSFLSQKIGGGYFYLALITSVIVGIIGIKCFKNLLPKDQGRAFAVNGELSEGKPRGAGIILTTVFTLCVVLFVPLTKYTMIYVLCIYGAMLTGFLDDAAETPWGNLKKGLCDLVIAAAMAITSYFNTKGIIVIELTNTKFQMPAWLYIILAAVLVWTAINVTNCSDGVDGLCASLVMSVLIVLLIFSQIMLSTAYYCMTLIMLGILGAYLWYNCSPSKMLMGDAGSRALGVFLAMLFLMSGRPFLFIPLALVIILDGGLGLLKLSFRRFLKMKNFMDNIRTPLHDHARKNKGWSDTQVVTRFSLLQFASGIIYITLSLCISYISG